jgi:hypothetical protein
VNANGDVMVGYTQFASNQHPSAGYSVHLAGDALNSIRDPLVYHAGEDYYHKTFSTATGRNRWGDFSTAQVDPSDDMSLWTLQEYGKSRLGTNDGNTGANSSRWGSWWGQLAPPKVTIDSRPESERDQRRHDAVQLHGAAVVCVRAAHYRELPHRRWLGHGGGQRLSVGDVVRDHSGGQHHGADQHQREG